MRTFFIITIVAASFLHPLTGHGPTDDFADHDLDQEVLKSRPLAEGYSDLAREILQHAGYRFDPSDLEKIQQSHRYYQLADEAATTDPEESRLIRSAGDALLERVLKASDVPQEIRIKANTLETNWNRLHKVPREDGVVILHIITDQAGPSQAFTIEKNLETHQEHNDTLVIPFYSKGESWVLLRLKRPPLEEAIVPFKLVAEDSNELSFDASVNVVSEAMGSLNFVVRDENGVPCPVMVELRSLKTNHVYRPSGAMEFSEQMDHIAGTPVHSPHRPDAGQGVPYIASLPGREWGMYYCVAEPFDMALPVGEWSVKVWRGNEYQSFQDTIHIEKGKQTSFDYSLKRWIDMAERGWFSGDDHIHSRLMSDEDADRLLTFMEATDLDLGNILLMGNNLRTFYPQRGFGKEYRVEKNGRFLVPGQEDPRYFNGHAIGLNITSLVRDTSKYLYNDWVADTIHEQGGLYGFAHLIAGSFNIINDMVLLMPKDRADFGEIHQSGILDPDLYYDFLNLGFELAAAGGSDVPYSHMMGEVRIYCYTGKPVLEADDWFDALRDGHSFVTNGPILELEVEGAIPGERIVLDQDEMLSVKARAMGPPNGDTPQRIELVWLGNVIASKSSLDSRRSVLSLDVEIPVGYGGWLALRTYTQDGKAAHTTPVYVTRKGYRSWNVEEAPRIIQKCLDTLDAYRNELQRYINLAENNAFPPHQVYGPQLARMAQGGITRANEAEAFYQDLILLLEKELARRTAPQK